MIILFEENETEFANLGLGILRDSISCVVKEKLNDEFTLTMEYPATGYNFDKIRENRILYCKPNPYDNPQAFRIYSISKAIGGTVTIDAVHISYDLNSIPVKAFSATSLQDVIVKIKNGSIVKNNFTLISDILYSRTFKTTAPFNLRALLMSEDDSIISDYNAELKFDNYNVYILSHRGKDRGAVVRYGHNMTDINHTQTTDLLYNGVFPYYHSEKETTKTSSTGEFTKVYIVGSKPFQDGWLSYSKDGDAYHPVDTSPVQIETEGDYYQKIYVWDDVYNIYREKIYNQQITVIEGVLEPSWISIDWSKFPVVTCKATKKGYYKLSTDEDWGEIKGVGDTIFEGSILNTSTMENMIIFFSEVVPSKTDSENTEVSEIVDVQLDDPIIWLDTSAAKSMKHNRILMLDLTSEFDDEPTKERLKTKAEEYISKNKIGTVKHSTTLSFVDLSGTSDNSNLINADHIEIGDTIKVIYDDAGISVSLRVISTEYNEIIGRYNSIELGEKEEKLSSSSIQNGDSVSSLTNDAGYASVTTVNKLIAETVTANYIEALNAKLTKAQISQLEVERINVKGIIEASQFTIDSLVAKLLVSDNAKISDTLTAGKIKVSGDVTIKSGQISISSEDEETSFIVDRNGNLIANSVTITGGTLNINDGMFEVTNDGILTAKDAEITGTIKANKGLIGGFTIDSSYLFTSKDEKGILISSNGTLDKPIEINGVSSLNWRISVSGLFGINKDGKLYSSGGKISGFEFDKNDLHNGELGKDSSVFISTGTNSLANIAGSGLKSGWVFTSGNLYGVLSTGELWASCAHISGDVNIFNGSIEIQNGTYKLIELTEADYSPFSYYYYDSDFERYVLDSSKDFDSSKKYYEGNIGQKLFYVSSDGDLVANSIKITGGSLKIGGSNYRPNFNVTNEGYLSSIGAQISGNLNINSGEILLGHLNSFTYEKVTFGSDLDPAYISNVYYTKEVDSSGIETYVLSTSSVKDESKEYYKYSSGANFYVDKNGNLSAKSADIEGKVVITNGEIKLGEYEKDIYSEATYSSTITEYYYYSYGQWFKVIINSQTEFDNYISKLYVKSGTTTSWRFQVDSQGNILINNGDVSPSRSGITLGSENKYAYIGTDGSISLASGKFIVNSQGDVNILDLFTVGSPKETYDSGTSYILSEIHICGDMLVCSRKKYGDSNKSETFLSLTNPSIKDMNVTGISEFDSDIKAKSSNNQFNELLIKGFDVPTTPGKIRLYSSSPIVFNSNSNTKKVNLNAKITDVSYNTYLFTFSCAGFTNNTEDDSSTLSTGSFTTKINRPSTNAGIFDDQVTIKIIVKFDVWRKVTSYNSKGTTELIWKCVGTETREFYNAISASDFDSDHQFDSDNNVKFTFGWKVSHSLLCKYSISDISNVTIVVFTNPNSSKTAYTKYVEIPDTGSVALAVDKPFVPNSDSILNSYSTLGKVGCYWNCLYSGSVNIPNLYYKTCNDPGYVKLSYSGLEKENAATGYRNFTISTPGDLSINSSNYGNVYIGGTLSTNVYLKPSKYLSIGNFGVQYDFNRFGCIIDYSNQYYNHSDNNCTVRGINYLIKDCFNQSDPFSDSTGLTDAYGPFKMEIYHVELKSDGAYTINFAYGYVIAAFLGPIWMYDGNPGNGDTYDEMYVKINNTHTSLTIYNDGGQTRSCYVMAIILGNH